MQRLGTIPLTSEKRVDEPGGAAFLLSSPPKKDKVIYLEGGEVEVQKGQPYVVARFAPATDANAAFSDGHNFAQRGLDLMSILGTQDATMHDAEDEHLIWWTESAGMVLRIVTTQLLKFEVGHITLKVTDSEGKVVPPTPAHPRHHIAFRFYRLAQVTDDLFDAYRNMYLAFEVLLSSQYPKRNTESEIEWLRRALKSASTVVRLDGLGVDSGVDLVESILQIVYKDARLLLFHAKEGRLYFAPQDSPLNRQAVSRALSLLTQIVLRMAEAWFDARRVGGLVFFGWVYENARTLLAECSAYASSYNGPFDATERDLTHLRFQTAIKLHSRLAPELQRGREPALLSFANISELSEVSPLRRIDLATKDHPVIAEMLEAPIELDSISRFENLMHIRGMNLNQPRSLYRK